MNTRGSEWRKWDLHVHTPASLCSEYGGDNDEIWEQFIQRIENLPSDIKVLGINDYLFLDGYEKVLKYKKDGRIPNIELLLPVIEFRLKEFVGSKELGRINYHIIFADESLLSPQDIQYHFLQGLRSKANLSADIPNGCTWGGIITRDTLIDLGKHISASIPKEKRKGDLSPLEIGFNNLNFELSKIENLLGEGSDPNKYLEGKYFKAIGKAEWEDFRWDGSISDKKTIINNAHFVFTASPTVEQANKGKDSLITQNVNGRLLHCSDAHKFAQDTNKTSPKELGHCYTWIKSDTTFEGLKQTIFEPERIKIHSSKPEDKEKYRVIDSIKLSSDTFWNQTIHLNPNLNVIIGGRSTGKSTLLKSIALVTNPNNTELDSLECDFVKEHLDNVEVLWADGANTPRDIDFFRQNYMHEIAKDKEQTDNLILRILKDKSIYSIWQDYQIFCSNNKAEIQSLINKVFDTKKQINNKLINLNEKGDKEGISKEINDLNQKISSIKSQLDISPEEMKLYEDIMKLITDNANKIKTVNCYMEELNKLKVFPFINSSFDTQLVSLSSYLKVALKIKIQDCQHDCLENIKSEIDKYIKELLQDVYSLNSSIEKAKQNSLFVKGQDVSSKNKEYKELIQKVEKEQVKLQTITNELVIIDNLNTVLELLKCDLLVKHISYKNKGIEVVAILKIKHEGIEIKSNLIYDNKRLQLFLENRLNLRGWERQSYIQNMWQNYSKDTSNISMIFLNDVLSDNIDYKASNRDENVLSEFLSENWFNISFDLIYEGDSFVSMSQGKQAFVILKLLLEFSDKTCPILIDQPEDSLDNRAIYKDLVKYLRKKKIERQIIIVTHNPNVVVGADSELIIIANQHGKDSPNQNHIKFQYKSGSLENTAALIDTKECILDKQGIREHVCEILEGGKEAFEKRERKYGFVI
ncbi:TrlF family AAA-like ATPase [Bacteroides sp. PHL 2737]|uniref:TrlF family AAA-like ATPase n=1 Tax=Bacteroides sp. PHL 2737 TaxID=2162637 RepID=UPI00164E14E2|nr:DNA repair protein [Bacteroides sp. PHL 2737]QLK83468.1 DNA repair protein [Bacteroides sp. PHL 2737]